MLIVKGFSVTATVDSVKELQTLGLRDIESIFESSNENEPISLKIICNDKKLSNGTQTNFSIDVKGNSNNVEEFVKNVKKIKKVALNYYKNSRKKITIKIKQL